MIITYNLNPLFKKDLGSFSKSYLNLKLWVVKLLKLNIEKSWFDNQETRYCHLAIQNVLPKLLPGPNLQFCFMKNSVYTSLLGSLLAALLWYDNDIVHHWRRISLSFTYFVDADHFLWGRVGRWWLIRGWWPVIWLALYIVVRAGRALRSLVAPTYALVVPCFSTEITY